MVNCQFNQSQDFQAYIKGHYKALYHLIIHFNNPTWASSKPALLWRPARLHEAGFRIESPQVGFTPVFELKAREIEGPRDRRSGELIMPVFEFKIRTKQVWRIANALHRSSNLKARVTERPRDHETTRREDEDQRPRDNWRHSKTDGFKREDWFWNWEPAILKARSVEGPRDLKTWRSYWKTSRPEVLEVIEDL